MNVDPSNGLARSQLERLKVVVSQLGLNYYELPACPFGLGVAIAESETRFVLLSVFFEPGVGVAYTTSGVLKNVEHDRPRVLEVCNARTRDNPLFPIYLHDADEGWDILASQRLPIDLLVNNPQFLEEHIQAYRVIIEKALPAFQEAGVRGERHKWSEDLPRLLVRSLIG